MTLTIESHNRNAAGGVPEVSWSANHPPLAIVNFEFTSAAVEIFTSTIVEITVSSFKKEKINCPQRMARL